MSQPPPPVIGYAGPNTFQRAFVPSHERAKITLIFLWISVGLSILGTLGSVVVLMVVDIDSQGMIVSAPSWVSSLGPLFLVQGLAYAVMYILVIVFFLRWQHQAQSNLYALSRAPEMTPGWGVGWWFIPIMNLFRPYQNLKDVTAKSNPQLQPFGPLLVYWLCWIFSGVSARISSKMTEEMFTFAVVVEVISVILELISAVLLMKMMQYVIAGQAQLMGSAAAVRTFR